MSEFFIFQTFLQRIALITFYLFGAFSFRFNAVNKITTFPIDFGFYEAMAICFEAREFLIKVTDKSQIINDGTIEAFARNQQWNARWIWCQQDSGHATFQFIDRYAFDF